MPFQGIIAQLSHHIAHMPIWLYALLLIGLVIMVGRSFYLMVHWFRTAQTIRNVPTAKIRSAAQGYVELSGVAKLLDGPLIVSPLTGRSCVWYSYKIEEKVKRGKDSYWRVVQEQRSDDLFSLEDDTGRCVIDPDGAEVMVDSTRTWHKHHTVPPRRYTEQLIGQGDPLYAIGFFNSMGQIDNQQKRERVAMLLRQWKQDPNDLLHRYDANNNQQLDSDEYEQVRRDAERQVQRDIGAQSREAPLHVMTTSDLARQSYILSSVAEPKVIRHYQWRSFKSLLSFFAAGIVAVWAINSRLL